MKAIAYDKNGAPVGIGTMVRVTGGSGDFSGTITEVTYTKDGQCMVRLLGVKSRVNASRIEAVRMNELESEIYRVFVDYGLKIKVNDMASIAARIRLAVEMDQATDAIPDHLVDEECSALIDGVREDRTNADA